MKMIVVILVCVLCSIVHAGGGGGVPSASERVDEKEVSAVALIQEGNVRLIVVGEFNGNNVDMVLALPDPILTRDAGGNTNAADCQITLSSDGFQIDSIVTKSGRDVQNKCGAQVEYSGPGRTNPIGLVWYIQVREKYSLQIYTDIDRTYRILALFDQVQDNYVTTTIQVIKQGDLTGESHVVKTLNEMSVVDTNGRVLQQVRVDDLVRLRVATTQELNREDDVHPYGSYIYHCNYRHTPNGQRILFVGDNGCALNNNPFGLELGFSFYDYIFNNDGRRVFLTETKDFTLARKHPKGDFFFITCYLRLCVGPENSDSRCNNFCEYNLIRGTKKKRSAGLAEAEQVTLAVRIYNETVEETVVDDNKTGKDNALSSSMIAMVSAAAVMFVILTICATFVACYFCRRRDDYEEKRSSTNGSTSNLPSHMKEAHMWPNKI